MPTSKETRVRVEGLSKIIASVLPSSGFWRFSPRLRFAFMARPAASMLRSSGSGSSLMSRKCAAACSSPRRLLQLAADSAAQARSRHCTDCSISASLTIKRRQEAHDIVAGADREQLLGAQRRRRDRPTAPPP